MKNPHLAIGVIGGLALSCSGAPKPVNQFADTEAALRAAREVGAEKAPEAKLHTTLAQEQLSRADKLMSDGDNDGAKRLLERAKADAELALALARCSDAQTELDNMKTQTPHPSQTSTQSAGGHP